MRMSWLVCALLGALAWGQVEPGAPSQTPGEPSADSSAAAATVPADAAVITVEGVCSTTPKTAAAKSTPASPRTAPADCKTIVTKAEFEKLASGVTPNMTPQLKRQLATILPRLIGMSNVAKKKGLDKTPRYEETIKFARMQILTNELQRDIQEEAAKVPQADIAEYYKQHPDVFDQFNLQRLFVPRNKQVEADDNDVDEKSEKLTDEQQKAKQAAEKAKADESEMAMTKLAASLRERAVAGEDFMMLQKEAFEAGGMKIESPTVTLPKVRRTGLPPAHAAVFDLKVGEVSQVISDTGGHYIYKVESRDQQTLDQVKEEILTKLKSERTREMMDKVTNSFKTVVNETYFGPNANMPTPSSRPMNPRMPVAPRTPAQPPAETPAQPPAAKPN